MTTRRNELHDIIDALRLEKKSYSEDADKANPIKFGEQRFSSRAAAVKHWEGLPPAKTSRLFECVTLKTRF